MLRAFGAFERDDAVRNPDYLAAELVGDGRAYRLALRLAAVPALHACGRWVFEKIGAGAYWAEVARVRYFDQVLLDRVAAGVRQVVVLGAGLDSRPYRFALGLGHVQFIEVDRPAMAARKRRRVEALLGAVPDQVTYIPLDLAHDDLDDALARAGFDADAPVLVLWIGVSMYLARETLESVLRWVGERPERSSIGFDYLEQCFFEDTRRFGSAARTRLAIGMSGERLVTGFDAGRMTALMREHGLCLRSHLGPIEIAAEYLRGSDGEPVGRPFAYSWYAHAGVGEWSVAGASPA